MSSPNGLTGSVSDRAKPSLQAPHLHSDAGVTVGLRGGPVWLDGVRAHAPAEAVLRAYRQLGEGVLGALTGRFALAIMDRGADRTILAIDRMGIERLCYTAASGMLTFGASAKDVARAAGLEPRLRPQALFDYLLLHMVPSPGTALAGVHKLRPGTCACLDRGNLTIRRYWQPVFAGPGIASFAELREGLLTALRDAVADCAPDAGVGAFLSGGLDSSTVAGMLGRVSGRPPRTFSMGFGAEEYNELAYARIAARQFGAVQHEYEVTADDIVDAFRRVAAAFDEPFGNSSAVPSYLCARLAAQHGVTHLLAGDGGDELFGGNERYARQRVFDVWHRIPEALRRSLIEPLIQRIDPASRITPLRKLRSYADQARIPLPERLESWNFIYRSDLDAMLEPDFRAAIDTRAPLAGMAQVYAQAPSTDLLQQLLFYDWHYTLADNDLRKVGEMCHLAGVSVSYPMLDPRVIDLSLRVPSKLMMRGTELRSFYKQALADFLPDEILAKQKHGFGLPFGVWLKSHARLAELIFGLLHDLKSRRVIRAAFIDRLVAEQRDGHPGFYGYAIWDLAMLEAWFQEHRIAP